MTHDIDTLYGLLMENHLDLMYLPSGAVAWLYDRPDSQKNTAAAIGVAARDADPVVDAMLLRSDQNVLVLHTTSGMKFMVYPDGGVGYNGTPIDIMQVQNLMAAGGQPEPTVEPEGPVLAPGPTAPVGMSNVVATPHMHDTAMEMPADMGELTMDDLMGDVGPAVVTPETDVDDVEVMADIGHKHLAKAGKGPRRFRFGGRKSSGNF